MFRFHTLALAAILGFSALATQTADAEVKIYPYFNGENHCPDGLRPVSVNCVISCGTPNTKMTYQSVISHPLLHKLQHRVSMPHTAQSDARNCAIGTKGCTFD
jgi:hypothetical protein